MPSGVEVQVLSRAPVDLFVWQNTLPYGGVFCCVIIITMSKITDYLNQHLVGEVADDNNTRLQYATDGSILKLTPHIVVYPRVADDVRKISRFVWRLAERGQSLPLTARGNGTDPTGGAIGNGIIMAFPAHMSNIMEFDLKSRLVRVQSGITIDELNQAVSTHGLTLPIAGGMSRVTTIGAALATNTPGRQFAKYGSMRNWAGQLEVVLANGEIIQTGRINRKELSEKKGLQTLEGEIYRSIDNLIDDNPDIINAIASGSTLDAGGYAIDQVRDKDGNFDLTPLFVGSQGTLGIITQSILQLDNMATETSMIAAAIDGDLDASDLTNRLLDWEPSSLEFVDGNTLKLIRKISGYEPWNIVTTSLPKSLLFIEFDDRHQAKRIRRAAKILDSVGVAEAKIATDPADVELLHALYDSVAVITNYNQGGTRAIPLATDLAVSPEVVLEFVKSLNKALDKYHVEAGVWGNLGSGLIGFRPLINLANLGQRQMVFRLMEVLMRLIAEFEGSISGCNGAGRLLTPIARHHYDKDTAELFAKIKKIFDPYDILNTGVGENVSREELAAMLRKDYNDDRFVQYHLRG